MGPTACQKAAACSACVAAAAAAILLWGVGAESVHFRHYLQGGLLLADALFVTLLESLTAWQYLDWRQTRYLTQTSPPVHCRPPHRLLQALDTYRRAAVYAVLSVPCFVHVKRLWLPLVPGVMLLLAAALYAVKYLCVLRRQRAIVKVPTFVRFKDESASAETQTSSEPKLSHQSSFTSSHSGCSVQMGSKDSGIEATQRDVSAAAVAAAAASAASTASTASTAATAASAGEAKGPRKPRGLVRAYSSSPDRCCLINEDSLSLRD